MNPNATRRTRRQFGPAGWRRARPPRGWTRSGRGNGREPACCRSPPVRRRSDLDSWVTAPSCASRRRSRSRRRASRSRAACRRRASSSPTASNGSPGSCPRPYVVIASVLHYRSRRALSTRPLLAGRRVQPDPRRPARTGGPHESLAASAISVGRLRRPTTVLPGRAHASQHSYGPCGRAVSDA
jgi:hypothetical protein